MNSTQHRAASDKHATHGSHSHKHRREFVLYFAGLILFIVVRIFPLDAWVANLIDFSVVLVAGNHVVIEGLIDTYRQTKDKKKFHPNVHLLMSLAAFGAMSIGAFHEASLLILIFAGAHFLEDYAKNKSKKEITNLLKMHPSKARRLDDKGNITIVDVEELEIGDHVHILPGDQIPTDGLIINGVAVVDEASITGESIPREKAIGDEVFGSSINSNRSFTINVTAKSDDSVFGQILRVVRESQDNLSPVATKIKKFEPIYVTVILFFVPIFIFGSQLLTEWNWYTSFYRGMVALVASSPCALAAASIPANLATISNLAKRGVIFKGGDYIANFGSVGAVAFDKTGTLTRGEPAVTDYLFIDEAKYSTWLDIIVAMEKQANHPLANAILERFYADKILNLKVENHFGKGLSTVYNGNTYTIGKRKEDVELRTDLDRAYQKYSKEGKTVVIFSENDRAVGIIAMMDTPANHAQDVIKYLHDRGVATYLITGDNEATARALADKIGIKHVYSNVLPEKKAEYIKQIQAKDGLATMIGDGVNDAPALVTADIGFAMGEGTDVAIEVADVVIMDNNLAKITYLHRLAKKMNRIVAQNIMIAMLVVLVLNIFNLFGTMTLAVSVIFHEGSTLLVVLNGLRLLLPLKSH